MFSYSNCVVESIEGMTRINQTSKHAEIRNGSCFDIGSWRKKCFFLFKARTISCLNAKICWSCQLRSDTKRFRKEVCALIVYVTTPSRIAQVRFCARPVVDGITHLFIEWEQWKVLRWRPKWQHHLPVSWYLLRYSCRFLCDYRLCKGRVLVDGGSVVCYARKRLLSSFEFTKIGDRELNLMSFGELSVGSKRHSGVSLV